MRRGNGFGSVIKLSGKRRRPYAARVTQGWTIEGKQIIKYIGYYPTKREAVKALEAFNTDPYDLSASKITTLELFEKWKAEAVNAVSKSTIEGYSSAFRRAEEIHNMNFKDVKLGHLDAAMARCTPTMKKVFKNMAGHLYKYAMKHEIVEKDLSEFLQYETIVSKEKEVFKPEHIKLLWKNIHNHRYGDLPIILLYTGVRVNELLSLKCEAINLEERYFITGSKTEAGKNRKIPIHEKLVPIFEKRLANGHEYFITTMRGTELKYRALMPKAWNKMLGDVLNTQYNPHNCRHTFITAMTRAGVEKQILRKIVGHAAEDITDHYTHVSTEELLEAINKLEY